MESNSDFHDQALDANFMLLAHDHAASTETSICENCSKAICPTCAYPKTTEAINKTICEVCHLLATNPDTETLLSIFNSIKEDLKRRIDRKENIVKEKRKVAKDAKAAYKDFENIAERRRAKHEKLMKRCSEFKEEIRVLEGKTEKYQQSLLVNRTRTSMITADRDRVRMEDEETTKKIKEFVEMIKEQEEENNQIVRDIEGLKDEYEKMKQDLEIAKMDESELKKRVLKLQSNIEKVRKENSSLEYHIKVLNDEEKLKSGTISLISEKVSLITGPNLNPNEQKTNELSVMMQKQLQEVMSLYRDINSLKQAKKLKKEQQELANSSCKCCIQ